MDIYVINLDSEPGRWRNMKRRIPNHHTVHRFPATADSGEAKLWTGAPIPDPSRRQAITHTYRRLMQHLLEQPGDRFVVLQDDVHLFGDLERYNPGRIHVYGGWRNYATYYDDAGILRTRPGTLHLTKSHVCPQAFSVHRDVLLDLYKVWCDETRQVCDSWSPLLTRHATFDPEPTVEPIHKP